MAVVFAVVWLCAILYWRSSGGAPGGGQMLLVLGVLPLGLLAGLWLVRGRRAAKRRAPEVADTGASGDALETDAGQAHPPLDCLAGALRLSCGDAPDAVLALLQAPPRPGLHPRFRDRDGLPVFAAYCDGLETAAAADAMSRRLQPQGSRAPEEERLRALALLQPVAEELFDGLALQLPPLPVSEERVVAGLRRRERHEVGEAVRIRVLLPSAWPQPLRQACGDWLLESALDGGLDARRIALEVLAVQGPEDTWRLLDRLGTATADEQSWQLLLACDSAIGERAVHALMSSGRLMDSRRAEGLVPGEAAAGVLLRPPAAAAPASPEPAASMHRVRMSALQSTTPPRAAARATAELITRTLQHAAVEPDAVAMVVSDADQRPSRAVEASAAAATACPELDTATQCGALGVPCGDIGHVAPLALLALAAAQVRASRQPALALAVAAERERAAVVFTPPASASAPSPDNAGASPDLAA
ncbi:hypothetical protein [Luteimonas sp. R10]|uniref:hypothetical protein n=1 Tax=Luteimonas sp. R10 TaxID=3108176 RepID=UPI0030890079|nr:hypothetical protein U3649_10330 [Luteimonas sp. R10]